MLYIFQGTILRNTSFFSSDRRPIFSDNYSFGGTIASFTTERIISSIIDRDDKILDSLPDSDEEIEKESSHIHRVRLFYLDSIDYLLILANTLQFGTQSNINNITTEKYHSTTARPKITATPATPSSSEAFNTSEQSSNHTDSDKGFLNYLPVDLLKKVHKTLKLQPTTIRGKIKFLKAFERTLINEIGKFLK